MSAVAERLHRPRVPGARRLPLRVPRAALACAVVALANALAWSLLIPPFEVPDENAHYAYVQQLAERGALPHHLTPEGRLSPAEDAMLGTIGFYQIVGEPLNPAPLTDTQQHAIETVGREGLSRKGSGDALSATNNPPVYYALAAVPYKLAGGTVLDRLAAMRVLSALLGAVTVVLVFMFLSELLPATPWAWTAGALVAALQPLFGFMSAGVNNDSLLYLTAAGLLWAVARIFRRGLDPLGGVLLGGFVGLGLVSKLTLLGLVPAAALALLLGVLRRPRRRALRGSGIALALGAVPELVYLLLNHRGVVPGGIGSVPAASGGAGYSLKGELSYTWQLFLPRLPFMRHDFGYVPLWKTWFKGLVGSFGWLDYGFPKFIYWVALGVVLVICALAAGELVRRRAALRRRLGELCVYVLAIVGLCVEIGVQSYRAMVQSGHPGSFEQARYLLPMLGLYAAIVALAVRFGGRRWGPVLGALLVMLALGHNLYAQAITVARYYT